MIAVLGEAVVDLVETSEPRLYRAHPGGSPLNVAVGLARLGHPTALLARISRDAFGRMFRQHLAASGVDLSLLVEASQPSTLAVASVDPAGVASYDFWVDGTADWQWTPDELAGPLPEDIVALHTGSMALELPPGADAVADLVRRERERGRVTISYDPNVRLAKSGPRELALRRIEEIVALADVVKLSADDLAWLLPEVEPAAVARRWADTGPALAVVTLGAAGAVGATANGVVVQRPTPPVDVIDTVGAGDAFSSGLLGWLADRGTLGPTGREALANLDRDAVAEMLDRAALVAALTCARPGADPPTRAEVEQSAAIKEQWHGHRDQSLS
jgi:fructokinase